MSSTQTRPSSESDECQVEARFRQLMDAWRSECGPSSSAVDMAMHPAYQQIIGMGPAVVPLLLRALQERPDHWFWALRAVTGENPVPEQSQGRVAEMTSAWLEWGREHGYLQTKGA